jgi:hypothetical protein
VQHPPEVCLSSSLRAQRTYPLLQSTGRWNVPSSNALTCPGHWLLHRRPGKPHRLLPLPGQSGSRLVVLATYTLPPPVLAVRELCGLCLPRCMLRAMHKTVSLKSALQSRPNLQNERIRTLRKTAFILSSHLAQGALLGYMLHPSRQKTGENCIIDQLELNGERFAYMRAHVCCDTSLQLCAHQPITGPRKHHS